MFVYKDFGGIKTKDNKTIKKNMIIRSSYLYDLTDEEIKLIKSFNLKEVIDLRTNMEIKEKPDYVLNDVRYLSCPLFKETHAGVTHEIANDMLSVLFNMPSLSTIYQGIVSNDYSIEMIKKVMNEIVLGDNYPVLFHCSAGKDRTGIIAFLTLYLLNVDYETIMADYLEINEKNKELAEKFYAYAKTKTDDDSKAVKAKLLYLVDRSYIEAALDKINELYGSLDNFIENKLEIDRMEIEFFRKRCLVEGE